MLRYSLIFGAIAGVITIAIMVLNMNFGPEEFGSSEVVGYLIMLVVLSLIFVGVKRYRDVERGGVIRFLPALGLGLGIAAVAGVFYVASWETYVALSGTDYVESYAAAMIAQAQSLPEAERAAKIAEAESLKALYTNPLTRFGMTFMEVFPVGVIVALLSAAVLRNPRVLPAKAPA
ncbi:DUF4199 family protein [Altererythrobacter salegens]|uniref:DUF4199 family protein n=1 Tax=Croceibacterium salegens TaxID=1737568 RepID=A0A6I4SYZ1_9SPHN|nr:DUF4199 domain-containing protein [Croceibacterium salegens]MXO59492.1 DUF4199 family protein [Croceibacterium salegens]